MPYINPKKPYDHLKNLEDWMETIEKTIRWKFPYLKQDDFEDLRGNIWLKLLKYDFPNCIKGFRSGTNTPRSPYNYLFTCIIRAYYDYNKAATKRFTYQVDDLEEASQQFYFDNHDLTMMAYDSLSPFEQQMWIDCMNAKKNIHDLYEPWQIQVFCDSLGLEKPEDLFESSVD